MLYIIYGTNFKNREEAREKIKSLLKKKNINFDELLSVPRISSENYTLLPNYFGGASLFGERVLVNIDGLLTKEETREFVYKNINEMVDSDNVFIMDEPFALPASFQKMQREMTKLDLAANVFDASEAKEVKDVDPFYLCELVEKRDRKAAWQEFKKIYLDWGDIEAQAIHGALWWKWKMMWSAHLDGDRSNYFKLYRLSSKDIKYTKKELEVFGRELALLAMKANNGEGNLMRNIEKFILKI